MKRLPGASAYVTAQVTGGRRRICSIVALVWMIFCNVALAASTGQACGFNNSVHPPLLMATDAMLDRTAGIGEVLHRFKRALPLRFDASECSSQLRSVQLTAHRRLAPGLYDSGVAGIGLRLLLDGHPLHAKGDGRDATRLMAQMHGELTVELIKLEPLSAAIEINATELPALLFQSVDGEESIMPLAGKVRLLQSTCRTPDVRVDLGETSSAELRRRGASLPQRFQLILRDCPAGLASIHYQLDPVAPVIDATRGIAGMDERATARHVGVQISDAAGQPLVFSQALPLEHYRSANGGDYRIPLQARIVVPAGQDVQAGRVSSVINVTVIYE